MAQGRVEDHLLLNGMSSTYDRWIYHGEPLDRQPQHFEADTEAPHMMGGGDAGIDFMEKDLYDGEDRADGQKSLFAEVLEEVKRAAHEGGKFSRFTFTVKLLHIKSFYRISNAAFNAILRLLSLQFPDSCVPRSYDEALSIIRRLGWKDADGKKSIPEKVLRHFPLIPRLQRMFISKKSSCEVQWHKLKRQPVDNELSHPVDEEAWKEFDRIRLDFAADPRNIKLGIATDGFNPFGNMSTSYSMWPVFVVPYNLPPWACMDQSNFMISLLIPGPESPGKDFDVFMEPLVEELLQLWTGVPTYNALSPEEKFNLRAAIIWSIHDFPALHTLSGRIKVGYKAYVHCDKDPCSKRIRSKIYYIGHRRFLPRNHRWRRSKDFIGENETRDKPAEFTKEELEQQLEKVKDVRPGKLAKKRKREEESARTFLNIEGKTKDTVSSRLDLEDMGIREDLHLQHNEDEDSFEMPRAWYTMSKEEKLAFCEFLRAVKFPDGYAANLAKCVTSDGFKLSVLKTHDCHILLQRILPAGLRGIMDKDIYEAVAELGNFFRELCCKTLKLTVLERLEKEIPIILCKLEKIFLPAFFTVMVHLAVHLPKEAILRGPVQYGWMYPIERRYFGDVETSWNRPGRNRERSDSQSGDVSVFIHGVNFLGASQYLEAGYEYDKMVWKCKEELNQEESKINVDKRVAKGFANWFKNHIGKLHEEKKVSDDLFALACLPDKRVRVYSSCIADGVQYHTVDREEKGKTQNSGIVTEGSHDREIIDFYGQLRSILELQYNSSGGIHRSVVLFRCDWFELGSKKKRDSFVKYDGHFKSINTARC
ncbi:uncharacterized protein [Aegilops tauschii subsp. strangulata]|uniref:uncharacterized protein n=1 Tax=Aegilops tauschii subsp. strangulata TaxID=200361 RepID=UPI003CC87B51